MNEYALEKVAKYMKDWLRVIWERDRQPGFVVAVSYKGKVIFNEAYGHANLERQEKLTPQHIFRIASHSKTFTATSVMQLQEQGSIRIDDPIAKCLPWLANHKDQRMQNVTIRQLLSHGAGIVRDGHDSTFWNIDRPFPSKEQLQQEILEAELVIDNNTRLKYSNYGYGLLGQLIEELTGQSYNSYVIDSIIKPLGLKNTGPEYSEDIKDKLATGYTRPDFGGQRKPIAHVDTHALASATGFYSTAEDLCHYFSAHAVGSGKLLNDESKKEMQRAQWQTENTRFKSEYGLGLDIIKLDSHRLIGHGGGFPGYITKSFFDPKSQLAVVVLCNYNGAWSGFYGQSVIRLIDYFQANCKKPSQFDKFEGRYMNLFWMTDALATGDKIVLGDSYAWEPFSEPEELTHLEGSKFKISKTDSFSPVDEGVEFFLDTAGKVEAMRHAGALMKPEATYLAEHQNQKVYGDQP